MSRCRKHVDDPYVRRHRFGTHQCIFGEQLPWQHVGTNFNRAVRKKKSHFPDWASDRVGFRHTPPAYALFYVTKVICNIDNPAYDSKFEDSNRWCSWLSRATHVCCTMKVAPSTVRIFAGTLLVAHVRFASGNKPVIHVLGSRFKLNK